MAQFLLKRQRGSNPETGSDVLVNLYISGISVELNSEAQGRNSMAELPQPVGQPLFRVGTRVLGMLICPESMRTEAAEACFSLLLPSPRVLYSGLRREIPEVKY
jgi:hypothetical protein